MSSISQLGRGEVFVDGGATNAQMAYPKLFSQERELKRADQLVRGEGRKVLGSRTE